MSLRRFAVALVAVLAAAQWLVGPTSVPPAAASEDVAFTCFPHAPTTMVYDNTWGASRSGGRGHKGTDIMSPKGVEVRAVADGVVETLKSGSKSGYYVRLTHEGGWESWYMHLDNDTPGTDDGRGGAETAYAEGLDVGDMVRAGQVIGYVGDSGNAESAGSHTHFELHIDGRAVDPYPFLVAAEELRIEAMDLVATVATLPEHEIDDAASGALWGALIEAPAVQCLANPFKDVIKQLFGEFPSESVLLTRVVAR